MGCAYIALWVAPKIEKTFFHIQKLVSDSATKLLPSCMNKCYSDICLCRLFLFNTDENIKKCSYLWELYLFDNCLHRLAKDTGIRRKSRKLFCKKSIDYTEFIIQSFTYFIIFINYSHVFFISVKFILNLWIHFLPWKLLVKLLWDNTAH